jgi:hypothetical protein
MGGRLPQVIDKGEPAVLVCHWPGIYFNGEAIGFNIFKEVVRRLNERYDNLIWMKNSEIARYWAARELTRIEPAVDGVHLHAPFACPGFTIELDRAATNGLTLEHGQTSLALRRLPSTAALTAGSWTEPQNRLTACFDLPKGKSVLRT